MDQAKLTLTKIENIRKFLNQDRATWTLLFLLNQKNGVYSTLEFEADTETKLRAKLIGPRITTANERLKSLGIKVNRTTILTYSMPPRVLKAYECIFTGIRILEEEMDNQKLEEAKSIERRRTNGIENQARKH